MFTQTAVEGCVDSHLGGLIVSRAITAFEGGVVDEAASGVRWGQRVG